MYTTAVNLTWTCPGYDPGQVEYTVKLDPAGAGEPVTPLAEGLTSTWFLAGGLEFGTDYRWTVIPVSESSNSEGMNS